MKMKMLSGKWRPFSLGLIGRTKFSFTLNQNIGIPYLLETSFGSCQALQKFGIFYLKQQNPGGCFYQLS